MKRLLLILILVSVIVSGAYSFSEESRADLKRAAAWWGERADKLQVELGDIGRRNPDPSNPNDKDWQEYLKITAEILKAEEKQKLYEKTALFNYNRLIARDTVQVYRPVGDFMEFTFGRGVELVTAIVTQSWTDLVKLSVDSVLRTRIRGKIRSVLGCSEPVPELEKWMVVIGFGEDPWATSFDQAIVNWAKGDVQGKAMLLALQGEKGRQIYKDLLNNPRPIYLGGATPSQWLESKSRKSAEEITDKLGLATFIGEMAGKMWISYEMDDSIDDTLQNLKALKDKYKENGNDLSCEDLFLVWSKQKTIDPADPQEKKRLDDLKLGLKFFLKKIPGWYDSKTVPDHFEEIVRMIPIAEELGENSTADNLRDILIEFEYHKMTPEEIKASELQAQIEETRKYLISNLKVLRNYLRIEENGEVESQWNMTADKWNELTELGYDTDSDTEIQNLWNEIQVLLKDRPETDENNGVREDPQPDNNSSFPVTTDSNTQDNSPSVSQRAEAYKEQILRYAYALLSAIEDDDYNRQGQIDNEARKYNDEMKSGVINDAVWNDSNFTAEVNAISKKINNAINDALMADKNVYVSGATWLYKWEYNSATTNSGF